MRYLKIFMHLDFKIIMYIYYVYSPPLSYEIEKYYY